MSEPAVSVENLSKAYHVTQARRRHGTVREAYEDLVQRMFRRGSAGKPHDDTFWALRDVSFEVRQGDVLGIVGRNGAGKSTLLKILSRITAPTRGRVVIRGRVASLLEVGTGFHPELSGRENVYMNGSILGMKRAEIDRKFDEIVDFAGVAPFLDTPLKRYSSGMQVRLAFAVAAHLDPEILVVDEVLAVGDAEFQRKCLGRMQAVASSGRTVLFVSHNLGSVGQLCNKGVLLEKGEILAIGSIDSVIEQYLFAGQEAAERSWSATQRPGDAELQLCRVAVSQRGQVLPAFDIEQPIDIEIETMALTNLREAVIGVVVRDARGIEVLHSSSAFGLTDHARSPGLKRVRCRVPRGLLNSGRYSVTVVGDIPNVKVFFLEIDTMTFAVEATSPEMNRYQPGAWKGVVSPLAVEWKSLD